ncbi:QueT transporter family protein [Desulfurococcaceae archaeon MEX13E-LK6-19]|nr:QueT transporter family protein [Desulfurococcaceae archaeon MEX13E-LK6-19]
MRSRLTIESAKAAVIAAVYAAVTIVLQPISFGPLQVRISDALLPLPYIPYFGFPAVIGLTIGCLLANMVSPYGIIDIVLGTLTNFAAGLFAWSIGKTYYGKEWAKVLVLIAQILIVTVIIGVVLLHIIFAIELEYAVPGVLLGSTISIGVGGYILLTTIEKRMPRLWK